MKMGISIVSALLVLAILFTTPTVLANESITAEDFAARCADAGGNLTLTENLRVDGGTAELGECQVRIGAFRLEIQQAQFSATGPFTIDGQLGGELRIEHSQFFQSAQTEGLVNMTLLAHRLRVEDTTLDFSGHVILRSGPLDRGEVLVEAVKFRSRSRSAVLHIGASGRTGHEGRITVRESELVAEGNISIAASLQALHGRGRVYLEGNAILARGTLALQTGEEGRIEVHENNRTAEGEEPFRGIYAAGTLMITSGMGGRTAVDENRILAKEGAQIRSGGRTRVRENNFFGSGEVLIEGPRCQARDNLPEVSCAR